MAILFVYALHIVLLFDLVEVKQRDPFKRDVDAPRDMLAGHMFKLYEKFNKERQPHRDENTVRSFQALPVSSHNKVHFHFNMTSMPESEVILSASLHFLKQHGRLRHLSCRRSRGSPCHSQHLQPSTPVKLVLRGMSQNTTFPAHLGNITLSPHKKGHWQMSDVSSIVQWARARNELLISVEFDFGDFQQDRFTPHILPYILIFANDLAINEPNSITMSLQRYSPVGEEKGPRFVTSSSRIRREAENLQNFLPNIQYDELKNKELWYNTYFALKPKTLSKSQAGRQVRNGGSMPPELSFDKRTMKKARRKQWSEPRVCARRYLRVDFADIGWSEWILAPKAFDAYYCAGTCGFPMPKVVHPSNHATIQSIVRAVGIVPGVPEPCCIPEKMSELAVLFLDTSRNMVLKLYSNMSVETCACR
ncbi:growth/differentiation factor 10b [Ictalurus furcatus]|uniref:growth/differentiation factor 10b n=1 Tax=Ictalurus furcatus TaxID=66913 RepID=UPI00235059FF|nr:growth/differentiation factor 10b [Ictalurus furcatus]